MPQHGTYDLSYGNAAVIIGYNVIGGKQELYFMKKKKKPFIYYVNKYAVPCMWAAGIFTMIAFVWNRLGILSIVSLILYIAAALLAGFPIAVRAWQGLRYKTIGIEMLVTIAVTGAFFIGELSEAAIVTFLFQFGSFLEQKTMKKTRNAIKELTAMAPATAWKLADGKLEEVDVDEVEENDLLLIKTGSKIAVDGIVTEGDGYVNEASITGESAPVHKTAGDYVYAGTIAENGTLTMRATRVGEDTTFAKIIALVEEAQDAKSPVERFIDRFARCYTPAVVLFALLVLIILRNVDTAITVLVLACPGALVIGAPIANVAGIGRGARNGILLKGGDSIHSFAKTDTVVFDKTGTLTAGRPQVISAHCFSKDEKKLLSLAAAMEQASDHPLARAICDYAVKNGISPNTTAVVEAIKGYGLRAVIDENTLLLGSLRLMNGQSVTISPEAERVLKDSQEQSSTTVFLSVNGQLQMLFCIADPIREDASASIGELRRLGITHLVMLTGDNPRTARAVSDKLGLTEFHAELLPQDKLEWIKQMQANGRHITFVGDGVNDSPALTLADTGIAVGSGTDVAMESSDVVLMKSDLSALTDALHLARKTRWILFQNICIAIGTVIFLLLGLFAGYIHMSVGMLIHEASILAVIFNAMRLLR